MAARQGDLLGVIIKMPYWSASKVIQPQAFGPLRQYEMQHPKAHRKPATAILAALLMVQDRHGETRPALIMDLFIHICAMKAMCPPKPAFHH